ncbi:MAG: CHAT domain-containing protein [Bacteroidales bacterium]|nr:CHAT domain-containing protein [Bacteroidales bacterium]
MKLFRKILIWLIFSLVFYNAVAEIPGLREERIQQARNLKFLAENNYNDGFYMSALSHYKSSLSLFYQSKEYFTASQVELSLSDIYLEMGRLDSSRYYYYQAEKLYINQNIIDAKAKARLKIIGSKIYISLSEFEKSLKLLNTLKLTDDATSEKLLGKDILFEYRHYLGYTYLGLQNYKASEENFNLSLYIYNSEPLAAIDKTIKTIYRKTFLPFNYDPVDIQPIIDSVRAYIIRFPDKNNPKLINYYLASYGYNVLSKNYSEALSDLDNTTRIIINKFGYDNSRIGEIYSNYASVYNSLDEYDKAIEYCELALKYSGFYEDLNDLKLPVLVKLGTIYYTQGKYEQAIEYLKKSTLFKSNPYHLFINYIKIGNAYATKSNSKSAEYYYQMAENTLKEYNITDSINWLYLHHSKAYYYEQINNPSEQFASLSEAYKISGNVSRIYNYYVAGLLTSLSDYYFNIKNYEEALHFLQKALIKANDQFSDTSIYSNPTLEQSGNKQTTYNIITDKAYDLYFYYKYQSDNIKDLKESYKCYDLAVAYQESMFRNYSHETTKLDFLEQVKINSNNAIILAMNVYEKTGDDYYLKKAFEHAEKIKSATLMFYINESNAKTLANIPDTLLQKEIQLKSQLSNLYHYLNRLDRSEVLFSEEVKQMESNLMKTNIAYDTLISYMEKKYPEYYNLKYNYNVPPLPEIQNKLSDNEALIEYVVGRKEVFIFVITGKSISCSEIEAYEDYKQNVADLHRLLKDHRYGEFNFKDYTDLTTCSRKLYQLLIEPVEKEITNKKLIIVPDEILSQVPFEILLYSDSINTSHIDYAGLPYLIKKFPVRYAYSGSVLLSRKPNKTRGTRMLGFAPDYGQDLVINSEGYVNLRSGITDTIKFKQLAGAKDEIEAIKKLYKGKFYLGLDANESNFKRYAGGYSMIHLALHTILDDKNPLYSRLIFDHEKDTTEDGSLYVFEVYNLVLNANMVVLSGCNTGSGKLNRSEGILSLARSFMYAGCPSLVLTKWSVADKASADLMNGFYKYLSKKKPKDEALQLAKLEYINHADPVKLHPYYWAGYVIFGDDSPIYNKRIGIFIFCGFFLLLALSMYYVRKIKKD